MLPELGVALVNAPAAWQKVAMGLAALASMRVGRRAPMSAHCCPLDRICVTAGKQTSYCVVTGRRPKQEYRGATDSCPASSVMACLHCVHVMEASVVPLHSPAASAAPNQPRYVARASSKNMQVLPYHCRLLQQLVHPPRAWLQLAGMQHERCSWPGCRPRHRRRSDPLVQNTASWKT
jgi:hypothetical protein